MKSQFLGATAVFVLLLGSSPQAQASTVSVTFGGTIDLATGFYQGTLNGISAPSFQSQSISGSFSFDDSSTGSPNGKMQSFPVGSTNIVLNIGSTNFGFSSASSSASLFSVATNQHFQFDTTGFELQTLGIG
jgi:hypothetical protein